MATIVTLCGFECGRAGPCMGTVSGATFITSGQRTGLRALRLNPSGGRHYAHPTAWTAVATEVWVVYFWFDSLPTADVVLTAAGGATNDYGVAFKQSDGKLYSCKATSTSAVTLGNAANVVLATGQWYRVECRVSNTGGSNKIDVRVDGTAATQWDSGTAENTDKVYVGNAFGPTGTYNMIADDFVVSQTSGDYPLGEGEVNGGVPTADGTHSTGTAGTFIRGTAGANITNSTTDSYLLTDDVPLDTDTPTANDFVNQAANGATNYVEQIFGPLPGLAAVVNAPRAVKVIYAEHQAGTGAGVMQIKTNDNGTEDAVVNRGSVAGVVTLRFTTKVYNVMPKDSAAWSLARYLDLRVRFGYSSDANPDQFFDCAMNEAWFTTGSVPSGQPFNKRWGGIPTSAVRLPRRGRLLRWHHPEREIMEV